MKANELMIGDWLLWDNTIPCIVTTIGCDYIETTKCGITLAESHLLQGVPLTAEILGKNGFVCKEIIQTYWISEDGRILLRGDEWLINSNNKWSVHVDNEDMQTIGYFDITYVHELQHTLRLCGINKEITIYNYDNEK